MPGCPLVARLHCHCEKVIQNLGLHCTESIPGNIVIEMKILQGPKEANQWQFNTRHPPKSNAVGTKFE